MASGCTKALGNETRMFQGWDILWPHFSSHYGTKGILKFYHSGEVEHILSECGIQQGDPLGSILFALAFHPILMHLADQYPEILVSAYADNVALIGRRSQILAAADTFVASAAENNLQLNPSESLCYIPGTSNSQDTVMSPGGLNFPCTSRGLKILGSPIGEDMFAQELLTKIALKIESDLQLHKAFPNIHQRLKLATFCSNKRISYFLQTVSPRISRNIIAQLDSTFDTFWAETLKFPHNYNDTSLSREYSNAIRQIRLGIREGGCGCFRNIPILEAAHYSGLAQFVFWMKAHLQRFPWEYALESNDTLHQCLAEAFANDITGMMQWQIPLANSPPEESLSQTKQLPLCIPTFNAILHWPEHLFPTQQAFCAHIKQELRQELYKSLQPHEQKRLDCVSRSLTPLSKHSHLDSSAVGGKCQLYQSPMAFFSLTNYHELSNEAVFTVTSLLLGIPMIHAIYLKNQQPEYVDKDVWGDFCLNNSSHAAETRFTTHHSLACEIASISNGAGVPSTCDESKLPYRDDRSRKRADLMTLVGC